MTREEEIKARLDEEFVHWIVDDRDFDYKVAGDSAEDDIRYLLARNEELQRQVTGHKFISEQRANDVEKLKRRIELMDRVVGKARALSNTIGNPFAQHAMLHAALPRLIDNLQAELEGLDAKEQPNDRAD